MLPAHSCARHPACSDDAAYHSVRALSVCVRAVARVRVVSTICGGSAGCEGCASHSSSPSSDSASVVLSVRYCAPTLYLLGLLFHNFFVSTNLILCCLFKNLKFHFRVGTDYLVKTLVVNNLIRYFKIIHAR